MGGLVVALVLLIVGVPMELNRDRLIRRFTSRSTSSLPPGYSATRTGVNVYAALVVALGVTVAAPSIAAWSRPAATVVLFLGGTSFTLLGVGAVLGGVDAGYAPRPHSQRGTCL